MDPDFAGKLSADVAAAEPLRVTQNFRLALNCRRRAPKMRLKHSLVRTLNLEQNTANGQMVLDPHALFAVRTEDG